MQQHWDFLDSTNRFWLDKHSWSISSTLTEQLCDPCRTFILGEPIDLYWTALIQDETKDWVTLQPHRGKGRVDGHRLCLLSFNLLSWFICTSAHFTKAQCIIYNQPLLHAEQRDIKAIPQRDNPFLSRWIRQLSQYVSFIHLKEASPVILTLKTISAPTIHPEAFTVAKNLAQWLFQIDNNAAEKGCLTRLRMSAQSPSGPHSGGGSDNTQTGQKWQDCCAAINIKRLHMSSWFRAARSNKTTLTTTAWPI